MLKSLWRSRTGLRVVFFISFILLIPTGSFLKMSAAEGIAGSATTCDIQQGPCTKHVAGVDVTLDIFPKPVLAMKDLTFKLTVRGKKLSSNPHIDLSMPGMNMGPNRVDLRPLRDNGYEGQGIIVRCRSGQRTWKAAVSLPELGTVEFIFDVTY